MHRPSSPQRASWSTTTMGILPVSGTDTAEEIALRNRYSPYVGKGPATPPPVYPKSAHPTHVFFGDTHHHTANSGDAFMAGDRLTPEQSYRLNAAKKSSLRLAFRLRLSRPLDFLVVSDHAEGLWRDVSGS